MTPLPQDASPERAARLERELDRALRTLSFSFDLRSVSQEPVVLHSVRVALLLEGLGYPRVVLLAGMMHAIVAESGYPLHDIAHDFGDDVAYLIMANTPDDGIEDPVERYEEHHGRCAGWGEQALIVQAAALYVRSRPDEPLWLQRARHFLTTAEPIIRNEQVWQLLDERIRALIALPAGDRDGRP